LPWLRDGQVQERKEEKVRLTTKGKAAKIYHLTPKARRYMLAMEIFQEQLERVFLLSDEEVKKELEERRKQ